jgi:hypothetical protein
LSGVKKRQPPPEERRGLDEWFSPRRKAQRETDVALGKRSAGMGVAMRQIMWARWLDIAVDHELVARQAFNELVTRRHSDPLGRDFLASLVAMTASAHALEAVYGDIKYLIPAQRKLGRRYKDLLHAIRVAFGVSQTDYEGLAAEFAWLFPVRDLAVHPYTETLPTKPHPIPGVNSDVLHSNFNAVQSGRAVDIVMAILTFAESPPHPYDQIPHGHWISRWSTDRQPYFAQAHDLQARREASPLLVP